MSATLLDELRVLLYHPCFSSDGERGRRIASAFLGRDFPHGHLDRLDENEAKGLLAYLREKMVDRGSASIKKAVEYLSNHP